MAQAVGGAGGAGMEQCPFCVMRIPRNHMMNHIKTHHRNNVTNAQLEERDIYRCIREDCGLCYRTPANRTRHQNTVNHTTANLLPHHNQQQQQQQQEADNIEQVYQALHSQRVPSREVCEQFGPDWLYLQRFFALELHKTKQTGHNIHYASKRTFIYAAQRAAQIYIEDPSVINILRVFALPKLGIGYDVDETRVLCERLFSPQFMDMFEPPDPEDGNNRSERVIPDPTGPMSRKDIARATDLMSQGKTRRAGQVIDGTSSMANTGDANVINRIRNKFVDGAPRPFGDRAGPIPPVLTAMEDQPKLDTVVKQMDKESSGGITGWTADLIQKCYGTPADNTPFRQLYFRLAQQLLMGTAPGGALWRTGRLVVILQETKERPLVAGDMLYRGLAKFITTSVPQGDALLSIQLGVGTPGGVEPIIDMCQRAYNQTPPDPPPDDHAIAQATNTAQNSTELAAAFADAAVAANTEATAADEAVQTADIAGVPAAMEAAATAAVAAQEANQASAAAAATANMHTQALEDIVALGAQMGLGEVPGADENADVRNAWQKELFIYLLDLSNAFNSMARGPMADAIYTHLKSYFRFAKFLYNEPSAVIINANGVLQVIVSSEGLRQGCNAATLFFCVGFRAKISQILHAVGEANNPQYGPDLPQPGVDEPQTYAQVQAQVQTQAAQAQAQALALLSPQLQEFINQILAGAYIDDLTIISHNPHLETALYNCFKPEVEGQRPRDGLVINEAKTKIISTVALQRDPQGLSILGGIVGNKSARRTFLEKKSTKLFLALQRLRQMPSQISLELLWRSYANKLTHLLRTSDLSDLEAQLKTIDKHFGDTADLIGSVPNGRERQHRETMIMQLPQRMGGLGITSLQSIRAAARAAMLDNSRRHLRNMGIILLEDALEGLTGAQGAALEQPPLRQKTLVRRIWQDLSDVLIIYLSPEERVSHVDCGSETGTAWMRVRACGPKGKYRILTDTQVAAAMAHRLLKSDAQCRQICTKCGAHNGSNHYEGCMRHLAQNHRHNLIRDAIIKALRARGLRADEDPIVSMPGQPLLQADIFAGAIGGGAAGHATHAYADVKVKNVLSAGTAAVRQAAALAYSAQAEADNRENTSLKGRTWAEIKAPMDSMVAVSVAHYGAQVIAHPVLTLVISSGGTLHQGFVEYLRTMIPDMLQRKEVLKDISLILVKARAAVYVLT
jgi:hypothetical protein